jgi:threonine dehydratase
MVSYADIEAAAARLAGQVVDTPCLESRTLSEILGAQVFLKFENLQFTASFKERGALNKLGALIESSEPIRGVIAASAGNHAQGVAYHARRLGLPAVVVMPTATPMVKVERTAHFGAEVVLHGDGFDEAHAEAMRRAEALGLTFVHPFDDPLVIAGQGTLGVEMLRAQPAIDTLVIAVGGGGLIGGIATAARALRPDITVIGVQCSRFPAMVNAIQGTRHEQGTTTIAEGIAVGQPGRITREVIRERVDDLVLVDEGDIEQAIVMLLEIEKTVAEGAGAAGLAALCSDPARFKGRKVGIVLCGGNIDPLMLAEIIERGLVRAGRLTRLTVELRDQPGALAQVTACLAAAEANVEQVHHQRRFTHLPVQAAEVQFVLQTRDHAHAVEIVSALEAAGFAVRLDHAA